jgi:hypothetical protein
MLDAQSIRTMEKVKEIDLEAAGMLQDDVWVFNDDFSNEEIPYTTPLCYRITVSRKVEYMEDESVIPEFAPSNPSKILVTLIPENYAPEAPVLEYTSGELDSDGVLHDIVLNWNKTVSKGKYHIYKMNPQGNWTKIEEVAANYDETMDLPLIDTTLESASLQMLDEDEQPIYHHFKIIAENSSGMQSEDSAILTVAGPGNIQEEEEPATNPDIIYMNHGTFDYTLVPGSFWIYSDNGRDDRCSPNLDSILNLTAPFCNIILDAGPGVGGWWLEKNINDLFAIYDGEGTEIMKSSPSLNMGTFYHTLCKEATLKLKTNGNVFPSYKGVWIHVTVVPAGSLYDVKHKATANSVVINWKDSLPTLSWMVEYGLAGFGQGQGQTIITTTPQVTINGLTGNGTEYQYYIYPTGGSCEDCNSANFKTACVVSFSASGGNCPCSQLVETPAGAGVVLPPVTLSQNNHQDWTFLGWATEPLALITTISENAPEVMPAGTTFYPTADITLYAVYSKDLGSTVAYKLVTSAADLEVGATYVLGGKNTANEYCFFNGGTTTVTGSICGTTTSIGSDSTEFTVLPGDIIEFLLSGTTPHYANQYYLNNGNFRLSLASTTGIRYDNTSTTNLNFEILFTGGALRIAGIVSGTRGYIRFSNPNIRSYTSNSSGTAICLFKKSIKHNIEYTSTLP